MKDWRSLIGDLNAYFCVVCEGYIVTIDVALGVTPMFLNCHVLGKPGSPGNTCPGLSRSMMYPDPPWPEKDNCGTPIPTEPTWEWYRPSNADIHPLIDALARNYPPHPKSPEHVEALMLRRRSA